VLPAGVVLVAIGGLIVLLPPGAVVPLSVLLGAVVPLPVSEVPEPVGRLMLVPDPLLIPVAENIPELVTIPVAVTERMSDKRRPKGN